MRLSPLSPERLTAIEAELEKLKRESDEDTRQVIAWREEIGFPVGRQG